MVGSEWISDLQVAAVDESVEHKAASRDPRRGHVAELRVSLSVAVAVVQQLEQSLADILGKPVSSGAAPPRKAVCLTGVQLPSDLQR